MGTGVSPPLNFAETSRSPSTSVKESPWQKPSADDWHRGRKASATLTRNGPLMEAVGATVRSTSITRANQIHIWLFQRDGFFSTHSERSSRAKRSPQIICTNLSLTRRNAVVGWPLVWKRLIRPGSQAPRSKRARRQPIILQRSSLVQVGIVEG